MQKTEALLSSQVRRGRFCFGIQCYCRAQQPFNPVHDVIGMERQADRQKDKTNV